MHTKICRTICPNSIQSAFPEDRAETTECFFLGENRTEDYTYFKSTTVDEHGKNNLYIQRMTRCGIDGIDVQDAEVHDTAITTDIAVKEEVITYEGSKTGA